MIDAKVTRKSVNGGDPWYDKGGVEIGFQEVDFIQPELWRDDELASRVGDQVKKGRVGIVAMTGGSSSGLLTLSEGRASKVDEFEAYDLRMLHDEAYLDRFINRDVLVEGVDVSGDYISFEVPANATIAVINRWLLREHPGYKIDVEFSMNGSSGVGANIFTSVLGENRRPLESDGMTMIVGGKVEVLHTREQVDEVRGTQGYAGLAKRVRVVARRKPVNPGMFLLPLRGTTIETSFAESHAALLSKLAPWVYCEKDGTRISSADVLHMTGLRTVHRVEHHGDMTGFKIHPSLAGHLDDEHHAVLCVRTEGPVEVVENEDLIDALSQLQDAGHLGEFKELVRATDIDPVMALRTKVPERAREENRNSEVYSTSMDRCVKILFDARCVDWLDADTAVAYMSAYQAVIRCYQPLDDLQELGVFVTQNGHYYMTNTPHYYVGGHNPHPRATGSIDLKPQIVAAKNQVMLGLNRLHGRKFGPFTICVQEGEKHYPNDALGQAHFAATQPKWNEARAKWSIKAGLAHNARMPDPYIESVRAAGFTVD